MEKLLLAGTQIGDDELSALGNRRSQAVKEWLQTTGQVPEQRLFLVATKVGASPEGTDAVPKSDSGARTSRVEFSLK
jgi:outer membrane protein OmpA-like peptidoglycan-associated protein